MKRRANGDIGGNDNSNSSKRIVGGDTDRICHTRLKHLIRRGRNSIADQCLSRRRYGLRPRHHQISTIIVDLDQVSRRLHGRRIGERIDDQHNIACEVGTKSIGKGNLVVGHLIEYTCHY